MKYAVTKNFNKKGTTKAPEKKNIEKTMTKQNRVRIILFLSEHLISFHTSASCSSCSKIHMYYIMLNKRWNKDGMWNKVGIIILKNSAVADGCPWSAYAWPSAQPRWHQRNFLATHVWGEGKFFKNCSDQFSRHFRQF